MSFLPPICRAGWAWRSVAAVFLASISCVHAGPPPWWTIDNYSSVIQAGAAEQNLGGANVGQGKWTAQSAFSALETVMGPSSPKVLAIRAELFKLTENATSGVFYPDYPTYVDPEQWQAWTDRQLAPLQIGALKALAAPFYRHLSALAPVWLEGQLQANGLIENSTYFEDNGVFYPWNPADDSDSAKNRAFANIGQLKLVFSLRFETLPGGNPDIDGDGLTNAVEIGLGTHPWRWDTDYDDMPDDWELLYGLDPLDDGTIDPSNGPYADPDGDFYLNFEEYLTGNDPFVAEDTDSDGMPDGWEDHFGTQIFVADPGADPDGDGLTNLQEFQLGTRPRSIDSDNDLLPDGWEVQYGLDPLVDSAEDDVDSVAGVPTPDGLTNLEEFLNMTDPTNPDTDGDGVTDGVEVDQGSDPNDPSDNGQPPKDPLKELEFKLYGDYASWRMEIQGMGPRDQRKLLVVTPAPGQSRTQTHKLWKNNKYRITLHHTGTLEGQSLEWYCWEARVDNKPDQKTFNDYQATRNAGVAEFFEVGDSWVVDNRDGLMTDHNHRHENAGGNVVAGKQALLIPIQTKEVRFSGTKYHELKSDDNATTYDAPQWVDANVDSIVLTDPATGDKNYPVAYTKKTKATLGAKFKVEGLPSSQAVKIRTQAGQPVVIPETPATVAGDGTITLPPTEASNELVDSIKAYNVEDGTAFKIDWQMSVGGRDWITVGTTKHTVYLTKADPITTSLTPPQETIYNIACRNADGLTGPDQTIVDAIFADFKDRIIQRVKPSTGTPAGAAMKYWGVLATTSTNRVDLLITADGRCGAWCQLFTDCLRAHGINATIYDLESKPATAPFGGGTMGSVFTAEFMAAYPGVGVQASPALFVKDWTATANPFVPTDEPGDPAQGMANPEAFFLDHALVKYGTQYYDPSYGTNPYPSQLAWEDAAVEYYGFSIDTTTVPIGTDRWMKVPDTKGVQETTPVVDGY